MWNPKLSRALPVALVVALLAASPALAAPSEDAAFPARVFEVIAQWWADLVQPMERVFALNRAGVDPDGEPTATATSDEPSADTQSRAGVDPDG